MPRSGAVKKITDSSGPQTLDQARLVQELLSLGHPKLTANLATRIAREVQQALEQKPQSQVNAQTVSQLVEFKFKELGLIPQKIETADAEDEVTVSLPEADAPPSRVAGLLGQQKDTALPTLEKFLQHPKRAAKPGQKKVSPPRARFQAEAAGLRLWAGNSDSPLDTEAARSGLSQLAEQLTRRVAQVENQFGEGQSPDILAVEFFNSLANQEFYPHFPAVLGRETPLAYGPHQIWIDLPAGPDSVESALWDAQKIWQAGGVVSFALDLKAETSQWQPETFQAFLKAVENAVMALPESLGMPPLVGLYFSAEHPHAAEFIDLALSGKYFPRFQLCLGVGDREVPKAWLEKVWSQSNSLWFSRSLAAAPLLPRWGGGPLLRPYEACQLGTLNLAILAAGNEVDWKKFRRIIHSAVRFLDNLLEVTEYPLERIQRRTLQSRKLALGVMGLADLLAKLGFPYDSPQAVILSEKISRFLKQESEQASLELAKHRGAWGEAGQDRPSGRPRNESLGGVCPAEVLSHLAGVTPGIAAFSSLWTPTEAASHKPLPLLQTIAERRQVWSPALAEEFSERGSIRQCNQAVAPLKKLFAHRQEIAPEWGLKIQGAWEAHLDGTVAFPAESLPESFWEHHLPGQLQFDSVTLRSLSLQQNPLLVPPSKPLDKKNQAAAAIETAEEETPLPEGAGRPVPVQPRPRPDQLQAIAEQWSTPEGPLWFNLASDDWGPRELMVRWGKSGSLHSVQSEAMSRLITLLLGCGVAPEMVAEELRGLRGPNSFFHQGREILSLPDALAQFLDKHLPRTATPHTEESDETTGLHMRTAPETEEEVTENLEAETLH